MSVNNLKIIPFSNDLAHHFGKINQLWIEKYFELEPEDLRVLNNPEKYLINKGGDIIFAQYKGEIVGTCGLKKWTNTEYELVKMGVLEGYQGLQIGKQLGESIIQLAKSKGCKRLYLETNSQLKTAIQLYSKLGFTPYNQKSSKCDYARCDFYMEKNLTY